jgi:hypothetical protein
MMPESETNHEPYREILGNKFHIVLRAIMRFFVPYRETPKGIMTQCSEKLRENSVIPRRESFADTL